MFYEATNYKRCTKCLLREAYPTLPIPITRVFSAVTHCQSHNRLGPGWVLGVLRHVRPTTHPGRAPYYPPIPSSLSVVLSASVNAVPLSRESRATLRPTSTTTTNHRWPCPATPPSPARTRSPQTSSSRPSGTRSCTGWGRAPAWQLTKASSSTPRRRSSFRCNRRQSTIQDTSNWDIGRGL